MKDFDIRLVAEMSEEIGYQKAIIAILDSGLSNIQQIVKVLQDAKNEALSKTNGE